ncbi:hypothetical protein SLE2022_049250 [Rubroshorea leprosula]
MMLPLARLGALALRTLCKPIANRLKVEAGLHPRFRQFIINIAQVLFAYLPSVVIPNFRLMVYGFAVALNEFCCFALYCIFLIVSGFWFHIELGPFQ